MSQSRAGQVSAAVHLALALLACLAIGVGADLAATKIPPGISGIPSEGKGHLEGPSSLGQDETNQIDNVVYKPTVLQCYTWPNGVVTQTKDPQAPACVSGWESTKSNGGSTAPGVEGNVIRIGVPGKLTPLLALLEEYYNSHYEFYGRSIKFVPLGAVNSTSAQRAAVAEARSQGVFAAISYDSATQSEAFDQDAYLEGLAAQKIIGVAYGPVRQNRVLTSHGPYPWSIAPTVEDEQRYLAKLVCTTLQGKPARMSQQFKDKARKFAIVSPSENTSDGYIHEVDTSALRRMLTACGVEAPQVLISDTSQTSDKGPIDQAMYQRLKNQGVTSLVVLGLGAQLAVMPPGNLQAVGYSPELISVLRENFAPDWHAALGSIDFTKTLITIRSGPTPQKEISSPVMIPLMATGLSYKEAGAMAGFAGTGYAELGLIAAGIQAAGPDLTADTFAAGLESTEFPSPLNGDKWGYGGLGLQLGDHVLERDVALEFMDLTRYPSFGNDVYNRSYGPGRNCQILEGKRFSLQDEFPADDSAFYDLTQDCDAPGSADDPIVKTTPAPAAESPAETQ